MFTLLVYYHDVLRYTIIGGWDKVLELRSEGYYVVTAPLPAGVNQTP